MGCPKSLDYRQEIGKVVSSASIADEKEEGVIFFIEIIIPAVSRDECFPIQRDLKRVQVFEELTSVYRMEPIDSNRYGFVPGKITFDDAADNALQWVGFSHGFSPWSWFVELKNTVSELFSA